MLSVAVLSLLAISPAQSNGHYVLAGPLNSLMVEGSSIGASTSGLPITVALTNGGSAISNDFTISGPAWDKPIHVHLNEAKFAGGHLTGKIQFKNESGKVLDGL